MSVTNQKHFCTLVELDETIYISSSTSPLGVVVISFSWWDLLKKVLLFEALTIRIEKKSTPVAKEFIIPALTMLQTVSVSTNVQTEESKPDYTNQE